MKAVVLMAKSTVFRGDRLAQARNQLGMNQQELGEAIGANYVQISRYENGKTSPLPDVLDRLASVLNVSVDYLLGRTDDPRGQITEDSLPPDELQMLYAYRDGDIEKLVHLGLERKKKQADD